ncbi:Csa1 family protein [Staphylococcus saccharolyticus]|nr:Csa1 family protein [Staphylococcus saccharolyticus]
MPKLVLKGDEQLSGSSIGDKDVEYLFLRNKNIVIKFSDCVSYRLTY